ncbi:uncharacterized protein LOC135683190 isoform X2 [Rhopilema esculentum]|uniref:uncharacterized protein LOC135683190 isoform X2 n=1 Tax=Rhopilema esculentum TaxID=499914 RepID=UPI0031DBC8DA
MNTKRKSRTTMLALFVVLFGLVDTLNTQATTYVALRIETSWGAFCQQKETFKASLLDFVNKEIKIAIRASQIALLNSDAACSNVPQQSMKVLLHVSVYTQGTSSGTFDIDAVRKIALLLKNGATFGSFKVQSAEMGSSETAAASISTKMVIIIIAAVLAVYMLGYFCILATQSDSYEHINVPKAHVVSTVNKVYKGRGQAMQVSKIN